MNKIPTNAIREVDNWLNDIPQNQQEENEVLRIRVGLHKYAVRHQHTEEKEPAAREV